LINTLRLNTLRLELIPLSRKQLILYLERNDGLIEGVGLVTRDILSNNLCKAISMKVEKMAGIDAKDHPWITYWLINHKENQFGIGMLGFKGVPDSQGQVEIGYGIDPAYENQGYTTEAVIRLVKWAFRDHRCTRIIAPGTKKDNPASNRILEKAGMKIYNETDQSYSWALDKPDRTKDL
jgi:ribosomal-protein-alanine N-acetyltransferase